MIKFIMGISWLLLSLTPIFVYCEIVRFEIGALTMAVHAFNFYALKDIEK